MVRYLALYNKAGSCKGNVVQIKKHVILRNEVTKNLSANNVIKILRFAQNDILVGCIKSEFFENT